ncbi:HAD family hydrolase [Aeromicrobium wangtongii]|uniref:Beta-phosphoglucomutase n=1 Tax=Aeromicrobium wangtongii TaxID=2969247 RepID=A0ABY5M9Z2_9ACTN|nr:beta-phosphoglucomutase family hydrolase [Aeromicrobium wangtongii]MCD9199456.1 beta-phosphoglucomutase family hydrolase [Aeromicrobium wangtongii]UUP13810.1 beta-phosphoglucomutase family hydrolase [Aeromicrobium wangtongii]
MDWNDYDAALFDLDGVITPTAEVHMRAWAQMFNDFLSARGVAEPYTDADYFTYVDGKPRYDGVRSFLASRDITLPEGDPSDPAGAETVAGLGNLKNDDFEQILQSEGVQPYPGSVQLVKELASRGTKMAIVSSSRNAAAVLDAAGMIDYFPVIVSGKEAGELGLPGKPAPDTFLEAARQLGVPKERAVVFEDALSGVAAGRAGDFGLVIGVDRGVGADKLTEHGADVVVDDLAELLEAGA